MTVLPFNRGPRRGPRKLRIKVQTHNELLLKQREQYQITKRALAKFEKQHGFNFIDWVNRDPEAERQDRKNILRDNMPKRKD